MPLIFAGAKPTSVPTMYKFMLSWLGEGLLLSSGARWKRSRRLLTPAFHFDVLRSYISIKNEASDLFLVSFCF